MTNIIERKKTLEVMLQQKISKLQELEKMRNDLTTVIVQMQGKIELLNELEHEKSEDKKHTE